MDLKDVLVMNALDKEVSVQALGNWFTLKPGQVKRFRSEIGNFMIREKRYMGLVGLPDEFEEPEYKTSEDGIRILEEKKNEGVRNRIQHLQAQINNLQVSLRRDLEMKNIKADVL
jgi:hypothetical protein